MRRMATAAAFVLSFAMMGVATAAQIKNDSLQQVMDLSGLSKEIAEIPDGIVVGVQQARQEGTPLSDEQAARIEKVITSFFEPQKITGAITRQMKNNLTEADAQDLLKWYKSDLGKKITKAELDSSTPAAYEDMVAQAQTLLEDKERVKLAQEIDALVKGTELAHDIQMNAGKAIVVAIVKEMNPGQPVDVGAIEKSMAADEQNMKQQMAQLMILSLVYSYKDVSVAEIKKYIAFLQKPSARKFNSQTATGFKLALKESVSAMAAK